MFIDRLSAPVENGYLRSMWIATITHTVAFALLSLIAIFFRTHHRHRYHNHQAYNTNTNTLSANTVEAGGPGSIENAKPHRLSLRKRLTDATRIIRDTLLLLAIATIATHVGYGATKAGSILAWIGVGFSVLGGLLAFMTLHGAMPSLATAVAYGCFIVAFGLTFRD